MPSEFLLTHEVQEITLTRDPTRRRMEQRGQFPARIHISPRRIAWRRADIQEWVADPEGWPRLRPAGRVMPLEVAR